MVERNRFGLLLPASKIIEQTQSLPDHSQAPHVIAGRTTSLIEVLLRNYPEVDFAQEYLSSYTLDYLNRVQQGFHSAAGSFKEDRRQPLAELIGDSDQFLQGFDPELTEAFNHAMVAFAFMPVHMRTSLHGFSRKGILRPPETGIEILERIREMRAEVLKMISGQTKPHSIDRTTHSLLRTYLFFKTGGELELHQPVTQKEEDDQTRHLLRNIQF